MSKAAESIRDECEREMEVVMPALAEAQTGVKSITPNDLMSLRNMKNPPPPVRLSMEAICVLRVNFSVASSVRVSRVLIFSGESRIFDTPFSR